MAGRFVRQSKYRHVFGNASKREGCYDNLRITKNAWDSNIVKANPEYISVNWEASGGGAFAVIPLGETGKLPDQIPLFRGHTAPVLDTDWSPFDDKFIASGSDDGKVMLWKVPQGFTMHQDPENIKDVSPTSQLKGHTRKVGHVLFNPSAQNVLASSSGDYTIKIWDVETEQAKLSLKHADIIQSMSWNASGSLLVTTCRDKKIRVWDARQEKAVIEAAGHSGAKSSRAVWLGEHDRFATTGFSRMSDRQLALWDPRAASGGPIDGFTTLDQIAGVAMPFWDEGTQMLFIAGKGDGNIRYYEYENDKLEYLSQHSGGDPQRGIAFIPKRGVNTHQNEVTRAFRTVNDSMVEPVAFVVPRRAEVFQSDIYPPTTGLTPAMSSNDWFGGKDGLPPKIDLEAIFDGGEPKEIASDFKPAAPISAPTSAPAPAKREPDSTPAPAPAVAARGPPPSIKDNQSMSSLADKFADNDEEEDEQDDFDDSTYKPMRANAMSGISTPIGIKSPEPAHAEPLPPVEMAKSTPRPQEPEEPRASPEPTPAASIDPPTSVPSASSTAPSSAGAVAGAAQGLGKHLQDIKAMLEMQQKVMAEQTEKIDALTKEVAALKAGS